MYSMRVCVTSLQFCYWEPCFLQMRGVNDGPHQILTDRKAWTMSALTELRGLSLITTKICSSFSKPMKFPNHDFLASLAARQENYTVWANTWRCRKTSETKTNTQLYIVKTSNTAVIICLKWLTQGLIQVLDWTCLLMWELKGTNHSQN